MMTKLQRGFGSPGRFTGEYTPPRYNIPPSSGKTRYLRGAPPDGSIRRNRRPEADTAGGGRRKTSGGKPASPERYDKSGCRTGSPNTAHPPGSGPPIEQRPCRECLRRMNTAVRRLMISRKRSNSSSACVYLPHISAPFSTNQRPSKENRKCRRTGKYSDARSGQAAR